MTSRFGWLDTDEAQRRRMMEVVDLLRDEGTIDELGIGTIRDTIADALFPGLSVLHTRLRYVLFVPWLIDEAVARAGGQRAPARLRRLETELIESLRTGTSDLDESDGSGIIGISARGRLKRMPSAIYWALLGRWGIRVWDEGVEGHLRRTAVLRQLRAGAPVADDPEAYEPVPVSGFLPSLPRAPEGLLTATDFRLTVDEAEFVSVQIRASTIGSLLARLVDQRPTDNVSWVWELGDLASAPPAMVSLVDHARRLHTAIHGAPLLYNLLLAEESGRGALVDAYRGDLIEWSGELHREAVFEGWDRAAFWATILTLNPRIHPRTRAFVDAWLDIAAATTDLAELPAARDLITNRERQIKGARSRLGNRAALERWSGASGLVRLSYRWHVAQRLIADLHGTDGAGDARP